MVKIDTLIEKAREAQSNSFSPYSRFRVGSAVLTDDDQIFAGCNIESSSYGLSMCAERVALYKAISAAHRAFSHLVVVTDSEDFCPPCGACRQVIWDFAPDVKIVLVNKDNQTRQMTIRELYPRAFSASFLSGKDPAS